MSNKITTPIFRASFVNLFEARSYEGGEPKYSITAIFNCEPGDPMLQALRDLAREAAIAKFGSKLPPNLRSPLRNGAEKAGLAGFGPGTTFTNLTSKQQPGVVNHLVQRIIDPKEVYPGMFAKATITAFAYDQRGNRGVAFGLHNVQKVGDGERIDGRQAAENEFDAVDINAAQQGLSGFIAPGSMATAVMVAAGSDAATATSDFLQ